MCRALNFDGEVEIDCCDGQVDFTVLVRTLKVLQPSGDSGRVNK